MTEALASGYTVKAVAARIADMDIDAAGNTEKAAWKRYLALCLMALAKGVEKKAIVDMVFGKGGKASKTFHNMWTMANKARGHVTGNMAWSDVAAMGVEEAFNTTIQMINRHMSMHDVTGKNAYDAVCNMSLEEVAQAKANADAAKAEADAEAAAAKEAADKAKVEAEAQAKVNAQERTAAQAAIAALHEASKADLQQVMYFILNQLGVDELEAVQGQIADVLAAIPAEQAKAA